MGNNKSINQKGLAFHTDAKEFQRKKKLRKPFEAPPFSLMFVSFYKFFCSKDLGKIL